MEPTVSQAAMVIRQIACHLGQHSTIVFLAWHISGLRCYCESQVASLVLCPQLRGHCNLYEKALVTRPGKSVKVTRWGHTWSSSHESWDCCSLALPPLERHMIRPLMKTCAESHSHSARPCLPAEQQSCIANKMLFITAPSTL